MMRCIMVAGTNEAVPAGDLCAEAGDAPFGGHHRFFGAVAHAGDDERGPCAIRLTVEPCQRAGDAGR